jgi:hypothetical protein
MEVVVKRKSLWLFGLAAIAQVPAIAGNCGAGVGVGVGNPHCSGAPRVPIAQQAGVRPATDTQPPTQLGAIETNHHNTVLAPAAVTGSVATVTDHGTVPTPVMGSTVTGYGAIPQQPPAQRTPMAVPTATPPRQLPPQSVPKLVLRPGQANGQTLVLPMVVTGTQATVSGYGPVPQPQPTPSQVAVAVPPITQQTPTLAPQPPRPSATPMQVPTAVPPITQRTPILAPQPPQPSATPMQVPTATPQITQRTPAPGAGSVPSLQVAGVSNSPTGGEAGLAPSAAHRNALVVHAPDVPRPVTSGAVRADDIYSLEFIEPGLQRRTVKVYRTRDAAEMLYKDTIPLDQGGFQVIVIGTRNPTYIH